MPHHKSRHFCNYTPKQLFALVLDIQSYPEFLPWCKKAKIIKNINNTIIAELTIEFAGVSQSYISKVTHQQPNIIEVEMLEGPFSYLVNKWSFEQVNKMQSEINFEIDFKFTSKILETLMGVVFDKTVSKLTEAFLERAQDLYNPNEKYK